MGIKKGGDKYGQVGSENTVTKQSKATAFDSDMYKKDKEKRSMTKDDAYRVNLRGGGICKKGMNKKARGANS